jgi:hypothetical protein
MFKVISPRLSRRCRVGAISFDVARFPGLDRFSTGLRPTGRLGLQYRSL